MTETIIPLVILAAGLGVATLGVAVLRRVRSYRRGPGRVSSQPGAPGMEFSLTRYQSLFRLLAATDADFLAHHRHCPSIAQRWQRSQRRVARLYLRELGADFRALHRSARMMVAQSPEHAHLVPALFKQQVTFWRALIWIEIRISLHWGGAAPINPEALAEAVEALCRELSPAHDFCQLRPNLIGAPAEPASSSEEAGRTRALTASAGQFFGRSPSSVLPRVLSLSRVLSNAPRILG